MMKIKSSGFTFCGALFLALPLQACVTQGGYTPIEGITYDTRPKDHPIVIFKEGALPDRGYKTIAILDAHQESSAFVEPSWNKAQETLESQARAAGADAIIDIKETRLKHLENSIYHVSAKAIRYID